MGPLDLALKAADARCLTSGAAPGIPLLDKTVSLIAVNDVDEKDWSLHPPESGPARSSSLVGGSKRVSEPAW
jgi:hypothetical protein